MKIRMSDMTSSTRLLVAAGLVTAGLLLAVALGTSVCRRLLQSRASQTAIANGPALDPVANGITVVTYNTHLFKGSSSEVGFFFRNVAQNIKHFFSREGLLGLFTGQYHRKRTAPIVFDDDNRARLIADKIRASGADIVGLQEVWSYRRQQWFCRELASAYPYCYNPAHPRLALRTTSGLVLLSRYKLTDLKFSAFPRKGRPFFHDENWASKGVVTATVEARPDGPTFRIGISHACTDAGGSAQPNIRQIASQTTTNHTGPAIMMGDLNVLDDRGEGKGEYATMRGIFAAIDAIDAYLKVHGADAENACTVNKKENLLHRLFTTKTSVEDANVRLDYVFVRESGAGWRLKPEKAEVIRDWKYPVAAFHKYGHPHMSAPIDAPHSQDRTTGLHEPETILMDMSDHYPVKITFSVQRQ
jgi:endonuclease/exonuclease/phosphatase family metal-dependent hydrolase